MCVVCGRKEEHAGIGLICGDYTCLSAYVSFRPAPNYCELLRHVSAKRLLRRHG
jgi:hypothetical protein